MVAGRCWNGIATAIAAATALGSRKCSALTHYFLYFRVGMVSVLVLLLIYKGEGSFLEWMKMRREGEHGKKGL